MRLIVLSAVTAMALGGLGCGEDRPFVCPSIAAADDAFPEDIGYEQEAALVALVEIIPGFGGAYVHENQLQLVILLVEPSDALANRARDELVEIQGERVWSRNPAIAQKTEHDYAELWRYRSRGRNVFGMPEVYTVGIDGFTGVVAYGVEDETVKTCVEDNLLKMAIPATSFRVEVEEPTMFEH